MMDKLAIGKRIKSFMKDYGITQSTLAEQLGLRQSSISDMINGKRDTVSLALKIADHYNISSSRFLDEDYIEKPKAIQKTEDTPLSPEEKDTLKEKLQELFERQNELLDETQSVARQIAAITKLLTNN